MLVALVGAFAATGSLLTVFRSYDDEGYMLISLTHYITEGHLYTKTFSQYGPFYFYAQGIFFQLFHLPVDHNTGRLVTLVYWVISSLLGAVFVYRVSKSMFLACASGLCCMLMGSVIFSEPGHPQMLVLFLYMLGACLSLPLGSRRNQPGFFLLGCVGAALVFTKVNVGVFYIAGLAYTFVCSLPSSRIRSVGIGLTLAYAAFIPWMLMHASLNLGFGAYCLVATVAGIATFASGALVQPRDPLPLRAAMVAGAGLLCGTVAIVLCTSLQGVSLYALLWGIILNPMSLPRLFTFPLLMTSRTVLIILTLAAGMVGLMFFARSISQSKWFSVVRCVTGMGAIFMLIRHQRIELIAVLLPLTLIPSSRSESDSTLHFPRLFITAMAATQFLEAFPVAGSQRGIAAVPMILWAFLCISDGIAGWNTASLGKPFRMDRKSLPLDALIGGAILLFFASLSVRNSDYRQLPPASVGLKGSSWLHLPVGQAAQFESISNEVRENCNMLFTMPGMGSFNMWSGVPAPNGWNHDAWMGGIPLDRQANILRIVKSDSMACAIYNRKGVQFWDRNEAEVAALPLAHYVTTDMRKVAEFGDYEIRVHPDRSSPWSQLP